MDSALILCRVLWLLTDIYICVKYYHSQNMVMFQTAPKTRWATNSYILCDG